MNGFLKSSLVPRFVVVGSLLLACALGTGCGGVEDGDRTEVIVEDLSQLQQPLGSMGPIFEGQDSEDDISTCTMWVCVKECDDCIWICRCARH